MCSVYRRSKQSVISLHWTVITTTGIRANGMGTPELLHVPDELMRQKLPDDAVFELEQHFEYIIKKYGLRMENE